MSNKKLQTVKAIRFFCVQESGSGIHLILLAQSSQHSIVVVEVEPWADVEIGNDAFPDQFIDGARAD